VLAICGGGNAGHALAVVASQNFDGDVRWLVGSGERAELLRAGAVGGGLHSTGVITARAEGLKAISSDPADVIPGADVVLLVVPAYAHAPVLESIAPYLEDDALVGCLPARGGFEFDAPKFISGIAPNGGRRLFGLQTLPWSTRVVEAGRVVNFGALKAEVLMATMPRSLAPELAPELTRLLGTEIVPTDGFLNMTLGNPGQFIHPGLMYGLFRDWAGEEYDQESVPFFYAHTTEDVGEVVRLLSAEANAVAQEIAAGSEKEMDLTGVLPVHEWLMRSYPTQTADTATVASCFRSGPLQHRRAPMRETSSGFVPNFTYRYLSEDVPFGLVVTRAIAQLANVPTPTTDAVILWTQRHTDQVYLVDGKLTGPATKGLPIPQNHGIETLAELIDWYDDDARPVGFARNR